MQQHKQRHEPTQHHHEPDAREEAEHMHSVQQHSQGVEANTLQYRPAGYFTLFCQVLEAVSLERVPKVPYDGDDGSCKLPPECSIEHIRKSVSRFTGFAKREKGETAPGSKQNLQLKGWKQIL